MRARARSAADVRVLRACHTSRFASTFRVRERQPERHAARFSVREAESPVCHDRRMGRRLKGTKPGNPGKGERAAITVRVPSAHKDRYTAEARRLGISASDYLALVAARAHHLPDPAHLRDQELPLGA